MPPRTSRAKTSYETFHFDVDDWSLEYGFHVNPDARPRDPVGRCWESHTLALVGPLRSKTKRKVERVALRLNPDGFHPKEWPASGTAFGGVVGVRHGTMELVAFLPPSSLQAVLTAAAAGKVKSVSLGVASDGKGLALRDLTVLGTTFDSEEDS